MVYSNFYDSYWYTPTSERESPKPASFLLQQPSYKLYTSIGKSQEMPSGFLRENVDHLLLQHCVVGAVHVDGYTSPLDLPLDIQQELLSVVIELFYPSQEFFTKLLFNLDMSMDSKYSDDNWSCEKCQERKLNRQRNCPFLDKEEYHEDSYSITVGEQSFNICPMNQKDHQLISSAFEAYKVAESSFLPTSGGYGEQPLLFCVMSQKVKEKVNYYERKQLEEQRKRS